jgi:hypothetical protein
MGIFRLVGYIVEKKGGIHELYYKQINKIEIKGVVSN